MCGRWRRSGGSFVLDGQGFTLLELLLLLGVSAILAAAAVPAAAQMLAGVQLRAAALGVVGTLTRARRAALAEGRSWVVRVEGGAVLVGPLGSPPRTENLSNGTRLVEATSGGDVRFFPDGRAENMTLIFELKGQRRAVVVNQRGRLRLE